MEHLNINIWRYGWTLDAFFDVRESDASSVISKLDSLGCDEESHAAARRTIGKLNCGLTYSMRNERHSFMVVSRSTCASEFFNTLVHELNHVCSSIEAECGINPHSEEASYLMGCLMGQIAKELRHKTSKV